MGVIPAATDLAPACIWEECDLTIRLFQAHPCLILTSLSLKPSTVKNCRVRTRECNWKARKRGWAQEEKILQTYSSFSVSTSLSCSEWKLHEVQRRGGFKTMKVKVKHHDCQIDKPWLHTGSCRCETWLMFPYIIYRDYYKRSKSWAQRNNFIYIYI